MALYLDGLYIGTEPRFKEGKPDGYNMLVASGVDAHRVKLTEDVYRNCAVDALTLGQHVYCSVKVNAFRDKTYFSADNVQLIEEG